MPKHPEKYQHFSVVELSEHQQRTTNCKHAVAADGTIIARIPNYLKHPDGVAEGIARAMNKNSSKLIIPTM